MCGLAGLWAIGRPGEHDLVSRARAMAEALVHRGPDDAGVWADEPAGVALGFRRLSIIDLSPAGHQPMVSADGRFVTVFNGEIYNQQELRAELAAAGVRFRGRSDTEVLTEAIAAWGAERAVPRCAGMFALAAWDRRERVLWLARDRFGKKPLYYRLADGVLLFGSELKALRADPRAEFRLDPAAAVAYFSRAYVPGPLTIYAGVRKFPAGSIGRIDAGGQLHVATFWSPVDIFERGMGDRARLTEDEVVDETSRLVDEAVRARLEADVPLGVFLSGGVDSTVVAAAMTRVAGRDVRTFTIGFRARAYDEAGSAREVARHLGTTHTEEYLEPDDALAVIQRLPDVYDEPFADSSQIPTLLLCGAARRHVTVALSGDGGDEVFGGYNRYVWAERLWGGGRRGGLTLRILNGLLGRLGPETIDALYEMVCGLLPSAWQMRLPAEKFDKAVRMLSAGSEHEVYERLVECWRTGVAGDPVAGISSTVGVPPLGYHPPFSGRLTERLMLYDILNYLPEDILVKVDRASMAVSLEVRSPLLDHRLLEWTAHLPLSMKVAHGRGKWVLRRLAERAVPPWVLDRPKAGFGVPIDQWLRGPLRDWAEELLSQRALRDGGVLDPGVVRRAWEEHLTGRRRRHHQLWTVLMFQAWRARWRL